MTLRIATFNLENLDDEPNQAPTLADRIQIMRPQLERVNADILCLQEVHSHLDGSAHQAQHAQHASNVEGVGPLAGLARRVTLRVRACVRMMDGWGGHERCQELPG